MTVLVTRHVCGLCEASFELRISYGESSGGGACTRCGQRYKSGGIYPVLTDRDLRAVREARLATGGKGDPLPALHVVVDDDGERTDGVHGRLTLVASAQDLSVNGVIVRPGQSLVLHIMWTGESFEWVPVIGARGQ
jgi:hypothetical protein